MKLSWIENKEIESYRAQALILWQDICKNKQKRNEAQEQLTKAKSDLQKYSLLVRNQQEEFNKLLMQGFKIDGNGNDIKGR